MPYTKRKAHHGSVHNLLTYIMNDEKTEGGKLVSAFNCNVYTAEFEMENNRTKWKDKGSRAAYHLIQSFCPEDKITPEQANEIGLRLCKKIYPTFQCVVSTHIDKGHLHNHIAVCAMNLNGRKLEDRLSNEKEGLYGYKEASDMIAAEYGCYVMPKHKITIRKNNDYYYQWKSMTWTENVKNDIDELLKESLTFEELIENLAAIGYEIRSRGKYLSVKAAGMKKFLRLNTLGEKYSEKGLHRFFMNRDQPYILPDITPIDDGIGKVRYEKAVESKHAIESTRDVKKEYTEFQKTRYKEICRFYQLKKDLDVLSENGIYSYEDLTGTIENINAKIHKNNIEVNKIENKYNLILDKADKAQEFIRLFKTHQYCEYYKFIDENYEVPGDEKIFLKLKENLKIETVEEAKQLISAARDVRFAVNKVRTETKDLQNKLFDLNIIKEEKLIKSGMYIHNIKFGNNRIDYSKSTNTHWYVSIPYTNTFIYLDKELTTFNNKYGYNTAFIIDDKDYKIYNSNGESMTVNGARLEEYYMQMKQENDKRYVQ